MYRKNSEEHFNEVMGDVDDIIAGKEPKNKTVKSSNSDRLNIVLESVIGWIVAVIGIPVAIIAWFFWDFVPSFGVLVILSLILSFGITHGVNFFVPDLVELNVVWAILSGLSFILIIYPLFSGD